MVEIGQRMNVHLYILYIPYDGKSTVSYTCQRLYTTVVAGTSGVDIYSMYMRWLG